MGELPAYICDRHKQTFVGPFTAETAPQRIQLLDGRIYCPLCRAKLEAFLAGEDDLTKIRLNHRRRPK